MSWEFDPITQSLVFGKGSSSQTKRDIVKSILLDSNQSIEFPVASILFDNDSILFQDDEELGC